MFGQPQWSFVFSAALLVASWVWVVATSFDGYPVFVAALVTLRTVVFEWWRPWSPEPRWAQGRPSKNPDDY